MATIAERILAAVKHRPLDDDQLAAQLGIYQRQSVNQTARKLAAAERLLRKPGPDGKIVNALPGPAVSQPLANPDAPVRMPSTIVPEDDVKRAVQEYLEADGFRVAVAWGRERGIDIDARDLNGRRWIIEAKGGVGPGPQQVNYFLGAIGELVQRMADGDASYGLALPDNRQYRGLVDRLPALARKRLGIAIFWVRVDADGTRVEVALPPA